MYCPKCSSTAPAKPVLQSAHWLCRRGCPPQPVAPPWAGGTGNVSGQAVSPGLKMESAFQLCCCRSSDSSWNHLHDGCEPRKAVGKFWLLMASGGMVLYCMISLANR